MFIVYISSTKMPENVKTNGRMRFDDTKEEKEVQRTKVFTYI